MSHACISRRVPTTHNYQTIAGICYVAAATAAAFRFAIDHQREREREPSSPVAIIISQQQQYSSEAFHTGELLVRAPLVRQLFLSYSDNPHP